MVFSCADICTMQVSLPHNKIRKQGKYIMTNIRKDNKELAWAVLSKSSGNQLSQVIKVTDYMDADETVALQPDKFYKSGPFYIS
tara:strand:- start:97 stop:348 length:252 start_codon:yes stop_codon:yes gene_type:complete